MATLRSTSLLLTLFAGLTFTASNAVAETYQGQSLKLKTSVQDVNGVREIESGDYEKGIRKTLAALNLSSVTSLRAPLLNNLCVAHIASGNMTTAKQSCDDAVSAAHGSAIAYNNRAVLNCLTSQPQACKADLERAKQLNARNPLIEHNLEAASEQNLLARN